MLHMGYEMHLIFVLSERWQKGVIYIFLYTLQLNRLNSYAQNQTLYRHEPRW